MAKFVNIDGLKPIKVFLSAYAEEPILVYKKEDIDRRTAADVAPVVHGHWVRFKESDACYVHMRCSACSAYWSDPSHADYFRYCPNCGAKMDEEAQNDP